MPAEIIVLMGKRNYGTGTLYIAADGNWYGRWHTDDGRRPNRKIGLARTAGRRDGLTKREAEIALAEMMSDDANRIITAPGQQAPTVREVGARTVERARRADKKLSYIESLESDLRAHINPLLGDLIAADVIPGDVDRLVSVMLKKGLAAKTIRNKVGTLPAVMERARKDGLRGDNPVDMSEEELPRVKKTTRIQFLTPTELWQVLSSAPSAVDEEIAKHFPVGGKYGGPEAVRTWWPVLRVMILTSAMTGLRLGELRGLRWIDVGLKLKVGESFVRGKFDEPKSQAGGRAVPLASVLLAELEAHHKATVWNQDDDLVFAHPHTGAPLEKTKLGLHFKAALGRAGVRSIRFHDLRHTFATTVAASGTVSIRTLQEWLGHAHMTTTQIYSHYMPGQREAELINDAFSGPITGPIFDSSASPTPPEPQRTTGANRTQR
jgi:integrase